MKFAMEINLSGAALMGEDGDWLDVYSLTAVMQKAVEPIKAGGTSGVLMDQNGNNVGQWAITS
jgi:hypothetical protein